MSGILANSNSVQNPGARFSFEEPADTNYNANATTNVREEGAINTLGEILTVKNRGHAKHSGNSTLI
jgi:hypothetical protein